MIEFKDVTRKTGDERSYIVSLAGSWTILGGVKYSEKENRFVYHPNAEGDGKGNYHLEEIADLVEFLNVGERGISDAD